MAFQLDEAEIKKAQHFTGTVVESVERIMDDGKEIWSMVVFNEDQQEFRRAESVNNTSPSSRGYLSSSLYARITAWHKAGIKPTTVAGFEGWRMEFDIKAKNYEIDGNAGVSVKALPTKRLGMVEPAELQALKEKLAASRTSARQGSGGVAANIQPQQQQASALSEADIATLLALYDGKDDDAVQAAAFSAGLPPALQNLISTGSMAQQLIGKNLLDSDDDGRYHRVQ